MKYFLPLIALILLGNSAPSVIIDEHINRSFQPMDIEGWKFMVNVDVMKEADWPTAQRIMSNQLFGMKRFLKDEVISDMQKVTIYVDIKQKGKSGAEYHPSKQWLIDNKFSPNLAKCVEISNISSFLAYTKTQPWVMLHELMHGYHDQVLNFDNKEVKTLFDNAIKAGKYAQVQHTSGRMTKHYGATDHKEYLSEATEAYFGVNDFYPFVKAEIMEYDSDICNFLKKLER